MVKPPPLFIPVYSRIPRPGPGLSRAQQSASASSRRTKASYPSISSGNRAASSCLSHP